jgi:hypothetical protein
MVERIVSLPVGLEDAVDELVAAGLVGLTPRGQVA